MKATTKILVIVLLLASGIQSKGENQALESVNAVILNKEATFTMKSPQNGIYNVKFTALILNDKGSDIADILIYNDQFRKLTKFSGTISGSKETKIKMSDLYKIQYSQGLLSDDIYYTYTPESTYPYTISYEYQLEYKNGILDFPSFIPVPYQNCALTKASYKLIVPQEIDVSYYANNITENGNTPVVTQNSSGQNEYLWEIGSFKPVEYEVMSPPFHEYFPVILSRPIQFSYDKREGNQGSWEEAGRWLYDLNRGRDLLPESEKQKIAEMTKSAKSDLEKIKILYDYLGQKTRYVSIQLGIGGLQSFPVEEVVKTGFGDCKALSLYMIAMLHAVDIEAYYIIVNTDDRDLLSEYPSISQMNHVIVEARSGADTLWLECTNPSVPFGYIHRNIAGHDALRISPKGGEFIKIKDYPDTLNIVSEYAKVNLNSDGSANISLVQTSVCKRYEPISAFQKLNNREKSDYIASGKSFTSQKITNISHTIENSKVPSISVVAEITTSNYARSSQNRIFVQANPFSSLNFRLKKSPRAKPIYIEEGYSIKDTIILNIPEGYFIETRFENSQISTDFGRYGYQISNIEENSLTIFTEFTLYSGQYPKERYEEFLKFIQDSEKAFSQQIVLRKH